MGLKIGYYEDVYTAPDAYAYFEPYQDEDTLRWSSGFSGKIYLNLDEISSADETALVSAIDTYITGSNSFIRIFNTNVNNKFFSVQSVEVESEDIIILHVIGDLVFDNNPDIIDLDEDPTLENMNRSFNKIGLCFCDWSTMKEVYPASFVLEPSFSRKIEGDKFEFKFDDIKFTINLDTELDPVSLGFFDVKKLVLLKDRTFTIEYENEGSYMTLFTDASYCVYLDSPTRHTVAVTAVEILSLAKELEFQAGWRFGGFLDPDTSIVDEVPEFEYMSDGVKHVNVIIEELLVFLRGKICSLGVNPLCLVYNDLSSFQNGIPIEMNGTFDSPLEDLVVIDYYIQYRNGYARTYLLCREGGHFNYSGIDEEDIILYELMNGSTFVEIHRFNPKIRAGLSTIDDVYDTPVVNINGPICFINRDADQDSDLRISYLRQDDFRTRKYVYNSFGSLEYDSSTYIQVPDSVSLGTIYPNDLYSALVAGLGTSSTYAPRLSSNNRTIDIPDVGTLEVMGTQEVRTIGYEETAEGGLSYSIDIITCSNLRYSLTLFPSTFFVIAENKTFSELLTELAFCSNSLWFLKYNDDGEIRVEFISRETQDTDTTISLRHIKKIKKEASRAKVYNFSSFLYESDLERKYAVTRYLKDIYYFPKDTFEVELFDEYKELAFGYGEFSLGSTVNMETKIGTYYKLLVNSVSTIKGSSRVKIELAQNVKE